MKIAIRAEATRESSLYCLLAALCALDCEYLRTHPQAPRLYATRVRYERETPAIRRAQGVADDVDAWLTIGEVLRWGAGDCEDLACWRVAELLVREGIAAQPTLSEVRPGHWHVRVKLPSGAIEDPSAILVRQAREEEP